MVCALSGCDSCIITPIRMGNGPAPYSNIGKRAKGNLVFLRPFPVCLRNCYLVSVRRVTIPCSSITFMVVYLFVF